MLIGLTGGNGFLGSYIKQYLTESDSNLLLIGRTPSALMDVDDILIDTINSETSYNFISVPNVLIHCAARAHIMDDSSDDPLAEYRTVNTAGTLNLARQAAEAGVKRFIFISSIKVNGESTSHSGAFTADDERNPLDPYGVSKSEAEIQLLVLAEETGMEVVIIRPPLIYGPGVKANFASLLNLVSKGLPLPFACINNNKRSMVSVDNLVDLIMTCIEHPNAANQVFLVSDDDDLSTAKMVNKLAKTCGKSGWMLPVPLMLFQLVGRVLGKTDVINRLTGSLHVDISKTKTLLNWTPIMSVDEGFKKTADAFLQNKKFYNRRK